MSQDRVLSAHRGMLVVVCGRRRALVSTCNLCFGRDCTATTGRGERAWTAISFWRFVREGRDGAWKEDRVAPVSARVRLAEPALTPDDGKFDQAHCRAAWKAKPPSHSAAAQGGLQLNASPRTATCPTETKHCWTNGRRALQGGEEDNWRDREVFHPFNKDGCHPFVKPSFWSPVIGLCVRYRPGDFQLDSTGLDWTRLDSTGLDWTRLDSTGLDWTRRAKVSRNWRCAL